MNKNFKELRKAAFAVGFGFTIGKAMADWVVIFVTPLMMAQLKWLPITEAKRHDEYLMLAGLSVRKKVHQQTRIKLKWVSV